MRASLSQLSTREWILFEIGVKKAEDIIRWADELIVETEEVDYRLIELSTSPPDQTHRFITMLDDLREGGDLWSGVRSALSDVHDYVVSHPKDAERIAKSLYSIACWYSKGMPDDMSFIHHFDDAFFLARDGIYGGPNAVLADFISELARYKEKPNHPPQRTAASRRL